jgi:transposase
MMLPMSHVKVFLSTSTVDMRFGFDRLAQMVKAGLGFDPFDGSLFLFFNRSSDRARIIYFDGSGSCSFSKRLERGTFKAPDCKPGEASLAISATDLALLLEGVNVSRIVRPKPWKPTPFDAPQS